MSKQRMAVPSGDTPTAYSIGSDQKPELLTTKTVFGGSTAGWFEGYPKSLLPRTAVAFRVAEGGPVLVRGSPPCRWPEPLVELYDTLDDWLRAEMGVTDRAVYVSGRGACNAFGGSVHNDSGYCDYGVKHFAVRGAVEHAHKCAPIGSVMTVPAALVDPSLAPAVDGVLYKTTFSHLIGVSEITFPTSAWAWSLYPARKRAGNGSFADFGYPEGWDDLFAAVHNNPCGYPVSPGPMFGRPIGTLAFVLFRLVVVVIEPVPPVRLFAVSPGHPGAVVAAVTALSAERGALAPGSVVALDDGTDVTVVFAFPSRLAARDLVEATRTAAVARLGPDAVVLLTDAGTVLFAVPVCRAMVDAAKTKEAGPRTRPAQTEDAGAQTTRPLQEDAGTQTDPTPRTWPAPVGWAWVAGLFGGKLRGS